jgi:hypothetical protein
MLFIVTQPDFLVGVRVAEPLLFVGTLRRAYRVFVWLGWVFGPAYLPAPHTGCLVRHGDHLLSVVDELLSLL